MLFADFALRVQGIAVAVQAGDRNAGPPLKQRQVIIAGRVALQDLIHGGYMNCGQEATGIDFNAGQSKVCDDLERLRE